MEIKNIPLTNDLWGRLGTAAGQGIQQGLQGYATSKMQQLAQQQQLQQQESERKRVAGEIKGAFPFLSDQQAALVASAPPKERYNFLSQIGGMAPKQLPAGNFTEGASEQTIPTNDIQSQDLRNIPQVSAQPMGAKQPQQKQQLSPQEFAQALKKPETGEKAEARAFRQQQQIDKVNAPFLNELRKSEKLADSLFNDALEVKKLLSTGKVASGGSGYLQSFTPLLQSPETRQFIAKTTGIVQDIASQQGVASREKLKLGREAKPLIEHDSATQNYLIDDLLKKTSRIKVKAQLRDQLINDNDGKEPANLESKVNTFYKKYEALKLPPAYEYTDDAVIEQNDKYYAKDGFMWREIPKPEGI